MRIIEEPKMSFVFSELNPGDVFNYDGVWYMKIELIQSENSYINAVDLFDGVPEYIMPESTVDYRDVELRIKEV